MGEANIISSFGNQNEIYSGGKEMGKLIDDPVLAEVYITSNLTPIRIVLMPHAGRQEVRKDRGTDRAG